ncbi:MAG: ABC transporter ATP-binding protein [Acidobacteriota bacterium]
MSYPAIQILDVHKYYGKVHALRGLNLEVHTGEVFGFLGPNGAGKTTTIRCLLDLIRPDNGSIRIFGLDPQHDPQSVKAMIGYLPGDLHLDPDFTPREFLRYIRRLRKNPRPWQEILGLAERLDLAMDRKIKTFSQGNKQKIGIVQAFLSDVPLIVLDEPTLGLDPLVQQEVLNFVREAQEQGKTVFFSSHILSEVQKIADRVGIIRKGQLVEIAQTEDLINRSLTRVTVQFSEPVSQKPFESLPNVEILRANDGDRSYMLDVQGEMDGLVKALAQFSVRELDISRLSLEEVFLEYYKDNGQEVE